MINLVLTIIGRAIKNLEFKYRVFSDCYVIDIYHKNKKYSLLIKKRKQ